ncbi:MAG: 4-oxalocrotonate tautomerase [Nitrosopumilaceae archaeon]|nr:4-oxalocrotonate tautomerase family protein [Nitrosopumilaceae archaeon]NIT99908.1 4-oxalocrotonate tautomerase family protein [Nitrosopumilaceae archaeon]NIU86262.1 4-oxalocrotonate tautomerase [Nitrosopumilaceae archaeon]NIV65017.1 4-oxalocrotonate tautomerase [Nitrosopumilaceae archaeon]NIX60511.1 4-oxalocrotonate tautomerase [Nitrosopumilaceae archaeon]
MPLITVSMYPGRTQQQKDDFAKEVTRSAVDILNTKEEHVIVVFEENQKENWFLAGKQL